MPTDIVMDAGTYKTVLYSGGKIVLEQPSAVSVDTDTYEPLAFGDQAKAMFGRTPPNITTVFPVERGVISDYQVAEAMIVHFIKSIFGNRIFKPRVIVVVPSYVTTVQHHSLANAVAAAGCRNISTVESSVASAVGLGIDFTKPHGSMIVDIGGGTTDIATLSLGGVVSNDTLRVGSIDFDDAIEKYVRREKNILIGGETAEHIKKTIGSAVERDFSVTVTAKGRHLFSGLPETFEISSGEVYEAISDLLGLIKKSCQSVLEKSEPDVVADISRDGIYLLGGGARLYGMEKMLSDYLDVKVNFIDDPKRSALNGADMVLKNPKIVKNSDYQYRSIQNLIVNDEY